MKTLSEICGNTPLVQITDRVYGKLETYNPSGSVKDRMILFVVNRAIGRGEITGSTILCDATSGNTGIALSMTAASLGLRCVIFMPENMSIERKNMMRIFGADIVDAPVDDFEGAIAMRDDFLSKNKKAWSPLQFNNQDNVHCHYETTAPEIMSDLSTLGLSLDAFVHGSGTGGTIEGLRRYVIDNGINAEVVMVQPSDEPHGIQGIADGKDFLAFSGDFGRIIRVSTQEALERAKLFAKQTGLLVGISAGANIFASELYESENPGEGAIVTMLCDRGERYMSLYDK